MSSCHGQEKKSSIVGKSKKVKSESPKGNVYCGFLDEDENLWFGTANDGVYKFDGENFIQFVDDKNQTYERIVFITGDKNGNVWFGGMNGFWKYDGKIVMDMTRKEK